MQLHIIVQILKIQLILLEQIDRVNKEKIVELEVNIYSRWTSLIYIRSWFKWWVFMLFLLVHDTQFHAPWILQAAMNCFLNMNK